VSRFFCERSEPVRPRRALGGFGLSLPLARAPSSPFACPLLPQKSAFIFERREPVRARRPRGRFGRSLLRAPSNPPYVLTGKKVVLFLR
jgi:hypothetical protein